MGHRRVLERTTQSNKTVGEGMQTRLGSVDGQWCSENNIQHWDGQGERAATRLSAVGNLYLRMDHHCSAPQHNILFDFEPLVIAGIFRLLIDKRMREG